jgi:hypothetical protein
MSSLVTWGHVAHIFGGRYTGGRGNGRSFPFWCIGRVGVSAILSAHTQILFQLRRRKGVRRVFPAVRLANLCNNPPQLWRRGVAAWERSCLFIKFGFNRKVFCGC